MEREQHELYEYARKRLNKKRVVFSSFIFSQFIFFVSPQNFNFIQIQTVG
jgi:hypothetical protein